MPGRAHLAGEHGPQRATGDPRDLGRHRDPAPRDPGDERVRRQPARRRERLAETAAGGGPIGEDGVGHDRYDPRGSVADPGGFRMAVTAYVLIQTEVGKAVNVAEAARKITGVLSADDVTGPYDVIVKTEANSLDELGKLVVSQIQSVEGITRTFTCPVVNL